MSDPVMDHLPVAAIRLLDGAIVHANRHAAALIGDADSFLDLLVPDDVSVLVTAAREIAQIATPGDRTVSVEVRSAVGPPRRFWTVTLGPHPDGGAVGVLGDISEQRRLDVAMAHLATGVYTTDGELRGDWMPARLAESIGLTPELFDGLDVYALVHPDDTDVAGSLVERAKMLPGVTYTSSLRIVHPTQRNPRAREILRRVSDDATADDWLDRLRPEDGPIVDELLTAARTGVMRPPVEVGFTGKDVTVWTRLEVLPYRNATGEVVGMFVSMLDITTEYEARAALARAKEELWHQARHDTLTGLLNRAAFIDRLDEILAGLPSAVDTRAGQVACRATDRPVVLVCDLDGFKGVNDTHGHRVGDDVLVAIARRLEQAVRSGDGLFRYGGDEFVVLCEHLDDGALTVLTARIVEAVSEPVLAGGHVHQLGVSVGATRARTSDRDDPDALVRRADKAMYDAKAAGGRRAVVA